MNCNIWIAILVGVAFGLSLVALGFALSRSARDRQREGWAQDDEQELSDLRNKRDRERMGR